MSTRAKLIPFTVHSKWLLPVVAITLLFGCGETVAPAHRDAGRPELTFADEVAAVREGRSDTIRVNHAVVRDDDLAALDAVREHLRRINLSHTEISDAGLDKLHGLSRLESLYLDGTKVTDEGLARLVAALPNVHLHIDDHHHPLDAHGDGHKH